MSTKKGKFTEQSYLRRQLNRREFIREAALTGVSIGGLLAGASSTYGAQNEIGILLGSHMDYLKKEAELFEEEYGVETKVDLVTTTELRKKIVSTLITRTSPWDSTFVTASLNAELADKGWVVNLTDRANELWGPKKEGLVHGSFESGEFQGETYAIPVTIGCPFLIWNKELMEEVGLDPERPNEWHKTENAFDEFIEYAKAMTRKVNGVQHYGYVDNWGGDQVLYFYRYQVQARGGDLFDEDFSPLLTSEPCVTSLQTMVDMLHKHEIIDPGSLTYAWVFDSAAPFWDGTRGMIITWPFVVTVSNNPKKSKVAGKVGFAPNPAVETSASVDGSEFLAIPAYADSVDWGWKYIKYVTTKQMQKRQAVTSGWVPIYKDLLTDPEVVENQPYAPAVKKTYEYPTKAYWSPDFAEWTDLLQAEITKALNLEKTPEKALKDATKEIIKMRED